MEKGKELKATGIDWLGELPSNWHLSPLKYLCSLTTGNKDTVNRIDDGIYPFFVRSKNVERIDSYSYDGVAILTAGDGDICKIWHYINGKFDFHQRVYMLYDFKVNPRFLYYFISENFYHDVFKLSAKSTVDSLRRPMFENFPVAVPPKQTQTKIASFLDQKTAQIDTIIEKKQKLLQLLDEKKKSVINEVVTGQKVWDGDAWVKPSEVKESGVEWIGEIPVDWQIKKLKYLVESIDSGCSVNAEEISVENESEYGVLKTSCVSNYFFNSNKNKKVFAEEYARVKCPVTRNTIIVSRMNTPELVGASGYVEESHRNLFLPDRLWQLNFLEVYKDFVKYISYILSSDIYRGIYSKISTGSSPSMQNISQSSYVDLEIIFPPSNQIPLLIKKIEETNNQIILLDKKLNLQINKLQEYRQSLISEAVTGKIDISNFN